MVLFLILFPAVAAILLLFNPFNLLRKIISLLSVIIIITVSVNLLIMFMWTGPAFYSLNSNTIDLVLFIAEMALGLFLVIFSIFKKRYLSALLALVQSVMIIYFDLYMARYAVVEYSLYADQLSIIMTLIIGVIGGLICLYTSGYMDEFHGNHPEYRDRRGYFFFLIYMFISSMFGIVFSNNLLWLLFFWEITTFCSFLLIGYKGDSESWQSAFRALSMNLLGGIAFTAGIMFFFNSSGMIELDRLVCSPKAMGLIPAVCLAFAGLVKSAQMPFSSWLTGAMVAPTPVSALLHSSTMVKAGVYLVIRLAPALAGTYAGLMLAYIGGITFIVASFIAVSQRNAKIVLAYSTIANLGLIIACAGIDSSTAIWSAILLIIFHAVAKSLMFLCVGVVQNRLGSRDIEHMDYLISRMPGIAAMMVVGISGMFLAPFGMLISKWVTLKAFIDFSPFLAVILAYGSAATLFFWAKWLGKILSIREDSENMEAGISRWEWFSLGALALSTVLVCILFPVISSAMIEPYLQTIYGGSPVMAYFDMLIIMILMASLLVILPMGILYHAYIKTGYKRSDAYFCGRNMARGTYMDYSGAEKSPAGSNYYLEKFFGERRLLPAGVVLCVILMSIMFGTVIV